MDPARFLDHPPSPAVLRVLRADAAMDPPAGAEDAVWSRVTAALVASGTMVATSATLGAATPGVAASASASIAKAAPLSFAALGKLFGLSFGVGLVVSGAGAVVLHAAEWRANLRANANVAAPRGDAAERVVGQRRAGAANARAERDGSGATLHDAPASDVAVDAGAHAAAAGAARRGEANGALPGHEASAAHEPSAHPVPSAAPTSSAAAPSEESRIVLAARDALRAGEPRRALAELERADLANLPGLAQERLALEIDAWLAAGMLDIAKDRAAVFLQRYPDSPHAARFRSLR